MKKAQNSLNKDKDIQNLITAKTPQQYIERSIKSKLSPGQKGSITSQWLEQTGFTQDDLQKARNRNPYWKNMKGRGSYERNYERLKKYNFKKDKDPEILTKKLWTEDEVSKLYELNSQMVDHELAKLFKTSLPAINHIRRKLKLAALIMEKNKEKFNKKKLLKISMKNEKSLRLDLAS